MILKNFKFQNTKTILVSSDNEERKRMVRKFERRFGGKNDNAVDLEYAKSLEERLLSNISKNRERLESKYIDKKAFLSALNLLTKSEAFKSDLEGRSYDDSNEDYAGIIGAIGMLYSFATLPPNYTEVDLEKSLRVMDYLLMDPDVMAFENGQFILSRHSNLEYFIERAFSPSNDLVFDSKEISFVKR